jgi:hypothetical protein
MIELCKWIHEHEKQKAKPEKRDERFSGSGSENR